MNPNSASSSRASALNSFGAFVGFLAWANAYGHEIMETDRIAERGVCAQDGSVPISLSSSLSASFNLGYDPEDKTVFMVVEPEEFAWLPDMPIKEVVVGQHQIYVLTESLALEGESFPAMTIAVHTDQPRLWRAFPGIDTVGFMCVTFNGDGFAVSEYASCRVPLRFLND
jgi:hypothetical protein